MNNTIPTRHHEKDSPLSQIRFPSISPKYPTTNGIILVVIIRLHEYDWHEFIASTVSIRNFTEK